MTRSQIPAIAVSLAICLVYSQRAEAFSYGLGYMQSWSGCDPGCSGASSLSHTGAQIDQLDNRLAGQGNSKSFKWANGSNYASDLTEDRDFNGADQYEADGVSLYAYSGHGSEAWNGAVTFMVPMCHAGTTSSCWFDSENSRLGEGGSSYYATPYAGSARWLMFATCFSVDSDPVGEWWQTFPNGKLNYIVGYMGLSADSSTTEEVLQDFGRDAFGNNYEFKASWFAAVEDWWVDDTGSLTTVGTSTSDAVNRRDHYRKSWSDRAWTDAVNSMAWAWHSG